MDWARRLLEKTPLPQCCSTGTKSGGSPKPTSAARNEEAIWHALANQHQGSIHAVKHAQSLVWQSSDMGLLESQHIRVGRAAPRVRACVNESRGVWTLRGVMYFCCCAMTDWHFEPRVSDDRLAWLGKCLATHIHAASTTPIQQVTNDSKYS